MKSWGKLRTEKLKASSKSSLYGRQENFMTYYFDFITLYINRIQRRDGKKDCFPLYPKKDDLGIIMNSWGIPFTSAAAKVYNALHCNRIKAEIKKVLRKIKMFFSEKTIHNITDSKNPSNHWRNSCKTSWGNTIVCRFLKGKYYLEVMTMKDQSTLLTAPELDPHLRMQIFDIPRKLFWMSLTPWTK